MNIKEIVPGVSYVGVNDRSTPRFENLWPLQKGMSYNSYIVQGSEATALIDTAPADSLKEYLDNLKAILQDKPIDYLVVNHMEPDHSGLMGIVKSLYPGMKIVVNKVSLPMAKGYYHIYDDSQYHVVADGDTISLGNKTLRFITIPMVHWPETMTTYVEEDKVLFTCDALGCFGALPGGIVDTEMDTGWCFEEMERYYANIVAKYSPFVRKALVKIGGLDLQYVCPSHGPVWHDRIQDAVEVYRRLSYWEGEDGVVIAYGSMYGNTATLADKMARALAEEGIRKIVVHDAAVTEMSYILRDVVKYRGLVVGSPTYCLGLYPPIETLVHDIRNREMKNKVFGMFSSYTWVPAAKGKLESLASDMGWTVAASYTMPQGGNAATDESVKKWAQEYAEAYRNHSNS